jgi:hypothetical protein
MVEPSDRLPGGDGPGTLDRPPEHLGDQQAGPDATTIHWGDGAVISSVNAKRGSRGGARGRG